VKERDLNSVERPRYLGEIVSEKAGKAFDWHTHDFGQLISAARGSMFVGTRTRVLLLSPAMAIWIPPNAEHWMRYGSSNVMLYVDVNRQEADELGRNIRIVGMTALLNALMLATLPETSAGRADQHLDALHDLLRHEVLTAHDMPLSISMPKDRRIIDLAHAAMDDPGSIASVDEWLKGAAASRKTIERIFRFETGMPPLRWLRQARLLHAISQLASGKKISSVAFDLGYGSSSAFAYMFRATFGISPSEFLHKQDIHPRYHPYRR
jgi:AraC-like DNA-binding protein/quercetin dioxygenase-like cupin family protein